MSESPKPRLVGINHVALEVGNIEPNLGLGIYLDPLVLQGQEARHGLIGGVKGGLELPEGLAEIRFRLSG